MVDITNMATIITAVATGVTSILAIVASILSKKEKRAKKLSLLRSEVFDNIRYRESYPYVISRFFLVDINRVSHYIKAVSGENVSLDDFKFVVENKLYEDGFEPDKDKDKDTILDELRKTYNKVMYLYETIVYLGALADDKDINRFLKTIYRNDIDRIYQRLNNLIEETKGRRNEEWFESYTKLYKHLHGAK